MNPLTNDKGIAQLPSSEARNPVNAKSARLGVLIVGHTYNLEEEMNKSNGKTGLSRQIGAIASVVTMLGTAAVVAMAPVSQAQAVGLVWNGGGGCMTSSKGTQCTDISYRAEGGARGNVGNAKADARKRAVCDNGWHYVNGSARWGQMGRWKDWDWYYADINFKCAYGNGNRNVTGI